MLISRPDIQPGRVFFLEHHSQVLHNNPLQDSATRLHPVWVPPGFSEKQQQGQRFSLVFELAGFLGSGLGRIAWRPFDESIVERLNRLYHEQRIPDLIVVFPDAFTRLGGNQYINSSAVGNYGDYINQELLSFVDRSLPTISHPDKRIIYGKSSGGYGAFMAALLYPDTWGNVGMLSGDCFFDALYRHDWHNTLTTLSQYAPQPLLAESSNLPNEQSQALLCQGIDDGRISAFLSAMGHKERPSQQESHALMNLCMAATYDPDPDVANGFRIPFDAYTGEPLHQRWQHWLSWDPIHRMTAHGEALQKLNHLYLDCGWSDQYHIHYGMRQLSKQLTAIHVTHSYHEFSGTHSGIDHRIDKALAVLTS
ncbi:enterobactin/ferric enterobactin esterase [Ferrovum sp. JA12]|uniref:alpha/beta hydrolase n=1 Tax=Ferrovum sp. JA12 TaxID=1356299 RepID=UPI00070348B6|nr:alpha/beta hydrolase-fold protein [Ferrovum sp. JA12]KRH78127.1 enterobactin/ferric enterobactin esterase [Ferrovum sp. JA12]